MGAALYYSGRFVQRRKRVFRPDMSPLPGNPDCVPLGCLGFDWGNTGGDSQHLATALLIDHYRYGLSQALYDRENLFSIAATCILATPSFTEQVILKLPSAWGMHWWLPGSFGLRWQRERAGQEVDWDRWWDAAVAEKMVVNMLMKCEVN